MQPGGKLSGCKVTDQSGQNAEQQSEEYIGGIVHIQIQTGKSDEYRQDYGGDTQTPVIFRMAVADARMQRYVLRERRNLRAGESGVQ